MHIKLQIGAYAWFGIELHSVVGIWLDGKNEERLEIW